MNLLRALRYRNYQLFFGGQLISLIGTWMQSLAMSWLIYRMTGSAFLLGFIGFTSQISSFFITPVAGVWADHANRRKLVIMTQSLMMLEAFALAALVFTRAIQVWHIIVLSMFLGIVNSFDMPVRQSFTVDMVENKEDLGNAIALNSMLFNSARFIGPPLAGAFIAAWGEGMCFLANGISYIAVIAALFAMHIPHLAHRTRPENVVESLREGFRYTFSHRPIRLIMLLMALVSFVVYPYAVLMPIFAAEVLHGNAGTLGALLGAIGLGALAGGIFMASKRTIEGTGRRIGAATLVMGTGIVLLSMARSLPLSCVILGFVGFGMMVHTASSNTYIQTIVEDKLRGRVMGFYVLAFVGLTPFGSLYAGWLASHIGTPRTIALAGALCVCGSLAFIFQLRKFGKAISSMRAGS